MDSNKETSDAALDTDINLVQDQSQQSTTTATRSTQTAGTPAFIEFINSQDPNTRATRSAIHRHTAYHTAAQRRDTGIRSLRESGRPRLFEWQRRTSQVSTDTTASLGQPILSTSSTPAQTTLTTPIRSISSSPARRNEVGDLFYTSGNAAQAEVDERGRVLISPLEEAILDYCIVTKCEFTESNCSDILDFIRRDCVSTYLLLGYGLALRARGQTSEAGKLLDAEHAVSYTRRAISMLRRRLGDLSQNCNDENIQAVLLLVVGTIDFGDPDEVVFHIDALHTMVRERGGLQSFAHNSALQMQIDAIPSSRQFHLTVGCAPACTEPLRFQDTTFWSAERLRPRQSSG